MNYGLKTAIVMSTAAACYLNTLNGTFVFDDTEAIVKNQDLNLNKSVTNLFYNDFWGTSLVSNYSHKSYRPLTVLFYRTNIYFTGSKSPFWFHTANIILYMLICAVLYLLLNMILNSKRKYDIAFSSSILFSVHPVHTEVVCSAVGQADLLCSLMFFLAILSYSRSIINDSVYYYFITLIVATVSMFCKETGITVLGVCGVYDVLISMKQTNRFSKRKFIARQFGLITFSSCLLYLRWKIMNFTEPTFQPVDNPASFAQDTVTRVLSYNYTYFLNILLLIWPQWLCFDWSMGCISLIDNFQDLRFLFVLTFWTVSAIFVYKQLVKWRQVALMAITLIIVPFLPASNLLLRVGFVIAERTLFLPSAGFCLLVSCGFHRICHKFPKYKQTIYILFVMLCVLFMSRTFQRTKDWLNERSLFASALGVCPNNAKVHYNVAKVAADDNDIEYAEIEYRKALDLLPTYDQAMNNLANLLRDKGRLEEARQLLMRAVNLRPEFAAAWMNLGIVLATLSRYEEAEKAYLTALKHRRNYSDCYYNIGNLYLKLEKNEEALQAWEKAVSLNPSHSAAWSNTLVLLDSMELSEKVLEVGNTALATCPTTAALHFTIANTLGKLQRWQEAERHFQTAIDLNPQNSLYYSNFGVLYHRWGKIDKARELYENALRLNPGLTSAAINLKKIV